MAGERTATGVDPSGRACRPGVKASAVAAFGHERAHVRMHAPRFGEEHTASCGNRALSIQQMFEHGGPGAVRMVGLRDLRQLLGVAEEYDAGRSETDSCRIRERELAGLFDEDEVERFAVLQAREEPGGTRDEFVLVL